MRNSIISSKVSIFFKGTKAYKILVYYKSTDLFVLVYDAEKPEALEKLGRCYEQIQGSKSNDVKAIMVAMHNKKKVMSY